MIWEMAAAAAARVRAHLSRVGRRAAWHHHARRRRAGGQERRRRPRSDAHPPPRRLLQQPILLPSACSATAASRAARLRASPLRHVAHALVRWRLEAAPRQLGLLENNTDPLLINQYTLAASISSCQDNARLHYNGHQGEPTLAKC